MNDSSGQRTSRQTPVVIAVAIGVFLSVGSVGVAQSQTDTIVLPGRTVDCAGFIGFGAEWDSTNYANSALPQAAFNIAAERVRWMRLPVARVMMLTLWCYDGADYTWNTAGMNALYRELDLLQEIGTTVILTDWSASDSWAVAPGISGVDDPEYAEVIGTYLDYLINQKGYDCIKYFIVNNEPNWVVGDWTEWRTGFLNVAGELAARGLDQQLILMGSDTTCGDSDTDEIEPWHVNAVNQLSHLLGAYDMHHYGKRTRIKDGWGEGFLGRDHVTLEDWWRARWQYVRDHDPMGSTKPCIVGEAGMDDDANHPSGSPHINEHNYGVFMADYAVQAVRAGSAAVLGWMLDDNSHAGFTWGLWSNWSQGMELRPWFYPWALLTRCFPTGATVYAPAEPDQIRVLVAESEAGWSVCVVNRRDTLATVALQLPVADSLRFDEYCYANGQASANAQGFPRPIAEHTPDAGGTLLVDVPADAVVILAPPPPEQGCLMRLR